MNISAYTIPFHRLYKKQIFSYDEIFEIEVGLVFDGA
jgi:hypothetical protein